MVISKQYFLDNIFYTLCFMELFDLNSNLNNLSESLFIKDFLVDFSPSFLYASRIKFCILAISTKILNIFLAGLILINSQSSSFSNAFVFVIHSQYSFHYVFVHQFLLLVCI